MDLREALRTVRASSAYWIDYLEENGREDEIEHIDAAIDVIDRLIKVIDG